MTPIKIASGGSGSDTRRRTCAPAHRSQGQERHSKVRCRLAELYHAVDWQYCRFMLAVAVTVFVLVYVAAGRGR